MIAMDVHKHLTGANGPFTLKVCLNLNEQGITALFGPSGSGKTSILRMLAGLTKPDGGTIIVNGEAWYDSKQGISLPVQERRVGYVFQEYNLFPNMTLRENLAFALDKHGDIKDIQRFLSMAGLEGVADAYPRVLSGGQKQRAALIRALLRRPNILLLDEPFSALDLPTRIELQRELKAWQRQMHIPALFVSHDIADIIRLSHDVFIINGAQVERSRSNDLKLGLI